MLTRCCPFQPYDPVEKTVGGADNDAIGSESVDVLLLATAEPSPPFVSGTEAGGDLWVRERWSDEAVCLKASAVKVGR